MKVGWCLKSIGLSAALAGLILAGPALAQPADFPLLVFGGGGWVQVLMPDLKALEAGAWASFPGQIVFDERALFFASGGMAFGGRQLRIGALNGGATWRGQTKGDARTRLWLGLRYEGLLLERVVTPWGLSLGTLLGTGRWTLEVEGVSVVDFLGAFLPRASTLSRQVLVAHPYLGLDGRLSVLGVKLLSGATLIYAYEPWRLAGEVAVRDGPLAWSVMPALSLIIMLGV